jgi:5-methylcytosine-specific restriction enzyme A
MGHAIPRLNTNYGTPLITHAERERRKFYNQLRWRKISTYKRTVDAVCQCTADCDHHKGVKCRAIAEDADHIVPRGQCDDPYALDNLQSLCVACHNVKRMTEAKGYTR